MTKVLFYVDHTVGNVKQTEIGAETLQSVKVIKAMSIISFYTFANSFKWQLNFVIYKKICNCEIVVFYAIIFVRPSVRQNFPLFVRLSVCPSVRQSVRSSLSTFPNFRWAVKLFIRCFFYTHSVQRYFYCLFLKSLIAPPFVLNFLQHMNAFWMRTAAIAFAASNVV